MAVNPATPSAQRATRPPSGSSEAHVLRAGMPRWSGSADEIIDRLRENPDNSLSLILFYENYRPELERSALRWFGKGEQAKKAVVNILVGVARRAREFDSETMCPVDWIRNTVEAEGRRLHRIVTRQLRREHISTTMGTGRGR